VIRGGHLSGLGRSSPPSTNSAVPRDQRFLVAQRNRTDEKLETAAQRAAAVPRSPIYKPTGRRVGNWVVFTKICVVS
jgi:hypothetical protein